MGRGARPAKAKVEARSTVTRKLRKVDASTGLQLKQRLAEALEQHAAISEILQVISASPSDVQPVLDAVAERAARLCEAPLARVLLVDRDVLRLMAEYSLDGTPQARTVPLPLRRSSISGRAILDRATIHHDDVVPLLDSEYPDALNARRLGIRAALAVPLMREGNAYGAIFLWRREPGLFSPEQVALVQTFAQQVAIAIDNVRLFNETKESLQQQTATADVLKVISRSAFDLQTVLDTLTESACKLCDAEGANIWRPDGDGFKVAAMFGDTPEHRAALKRVINKPGRATCVGRALLEGRTVHIRDANADPEYEAHDVLAVRGNRAMIGVPLLRDGVPIGVLVLTRSVARPFTEKQIALATTFADQAVIAIENVRLFKETQEALEQQIATSEILRVISQSPTDVQPVFDTIVANAARVCSAESAAVYRFDGEVVDFVAGYHFSPEALEAYRHRFPCPLRETDHLQRVVDGSVLNISDIENDPHTTRRTGDLYRARGARSSIFVPMVREGRAIGAIGVSHREVGAFSDERVELLKTFADQAVIAIENVRLFNETKEALERQTATSEILRVISQSPTDVQPVFDTIAAAALKLCAASSVTVFTFDGELIRIAALVNVSPEGADAVRGFYPRPPGRDNAASRAVLTCSVITIPDVLEDREIAYRDTPVASAFRSVLAVPLMRDGSPIGAISVGRLEPGPFPSKQTVLLQTFADQAVIAIENVRLFTELEARTLQLTRSVGELKALGEVGQAISSTLDLETVLSTIVSRATHLAGMDGGSIWEYDEPSEQFYLHAADRLPDELVEVLRATPIRKGEGALGRLAVTGEPVAIRDIADESNYQSRIREVLIRCGYRSVLAVPLLCEDRLLGALAVNRSSPGDFAVEVVALLKTFATQSALAIQNARLFREIEDKSRQLEVASQHKSEFLANMSHELRTPLNAIIGFSEVLAERMFGEINDKQAEYLADILESGRHLLSLINDILDLSKIEAGRMELEPTTFHLPNVIENALTLVRERAQRHGITLGRTVDERVGMIRADERKVKQVLLNLLSNALKFTPEGGRIDVRATARDDAVEISVTDTGVGIAPEDQATVFEEFRQVGSVAKKVEGTGLGLAISRKFIELHGGRIWVESQLGKGSTFAFTLPLPIDQHVQPANGRL